MRLLTKTIILLALSFLGCPHWAYPNELNQFYENFLRHLKQDNDPELESLVRKRPDLASKSLKAVEAKIGKEDDKGKIQGYTLVANELKELIGVTSGKKDCSLAEDVYQRGLESLGAPQRIKAFCRTLRLCPSNEAAYVSLGATYRKTGVFDKAVVNFDKALSLKHDAPDALLGLGETLFEAGLFQRSLSYFEKVLAIDPENIPSRKLAAIASKQITRDKKGFLLEPEMEDELSAEQENLMCMCPQFAKVTARLRLHEITFDSESSGLSSRATKQLDELAKALNSDVLKSGHYIIEGHADNIGSQSFNRLLSLQRAEAVKSFLVNKRGIEPSILSVVGAGDLRGWTTNESTVGRRANRRIEILKVDATRAK
jgi:outer membrane protein OmpA-like peptidoglycan-associated protein